MQAIPFGYLSHVGMLKHNRQIVHGEKVSLMINLQVEKPLPQKGIQSRLLRFWGMTKSC